MVDKLKQMFADVSKTANALGLKELVSVKLTCCSCGEEQQFVTMQVAYNWKNKHVPVCPGTGNKSK